MANNRSTLSFQAQALAWALRDLLRSQLCTSTKLRENFLRPSLSMLRSVIWSDALIFNSCLDPLDWSKKLLNTLRSWRFCARYTRQVMCVKPRMEHIFNNKPIFPYISYRASNKIWPRVRKLSALYTYPVIWTEWIRIAPVNGSVTKMINELLTDQSWWQSSIRNLELVRYLPLSLA